MPALDGGVPDFDVHFAVAAERVDRQIPPTPTEPRGMSDEAEIRRLNEEYVAASLAGDVGWYDRHLAEEFVCIDSDGSVLDKAAFLAMTARGSELADYRLDQVDVRFYGRVALVRAQGSWTARDGTPGMSRYVDIYARIGSVWKVVSAQITRPALLPTQ